MRKIPRTAKLNEAVGRVQFGSPRNFYLIDMLAILDFDAAISVLKVLKHTMQG